MSWFCNSLVLIATAPLFICWAIETVNACREAMAIRWYIRHCPPPTPQFRLRVVRAEDDDD